MHRFFKAIFLILLYLNNVVAFAEEDIKTSQVKLGILKHSIKSGLSHAYEKGYDLNGEYIFPVNSNKFFRAIFSPSIHIGANINTNKATSMLYTGLTWTSSSTKPIFVEVSFGGCIHNGKLKQASKHKKALGSRLLFRETISIGTNFHDKKNISLFLEHASNASIARPNPGITNIGIRYGFEL